MTVSAESPHSATAVFVCVLCGAPWPKSYLNVCEGCGGFCTWGPAKGADPDSWTVLPDGSWTPKPAPHGPQSPPVTGPARTVEVSDRIGRTDPDVP